MNKYPFEKFPFGRFHRHIKSNIENFTFVHDFHANERNGPSSSSLFSQKIKIKNERSRTFIVCSTNETRLNS